MISQTPTFSCQGSWGFYFFHLATEDTETTEAKDPAWLLLWNLVIGAYWGCGACDLGFFEPFSVSSVTSVARIINE
jgi:hypothetical protein